MKKIVLVCGLIGGLVVATVMVITIAMCYQSGNFDGNVWLGYASMLLAFSLIYVGIKSYRDKYNNGIISFGKAFKIGFAIALMASTIYVGAWLIAYYNFFSDFDEKYGEQVLRQLQTSGATEAELTSKTAEIETFKEMYKNPLLVILLTYAEILPVGLIVTLISALLLKRRTRNEPQLAT